MFGSAQGAELSFSDSDFFLNLDDVDIGPQIGQGAFSKVYLGRYLGELVRGKVNDSEHVLLLLLPVVCCLLRAVQIDSSVLQ